MSKKYRGDAMAAIHETMAALHKVGSPDLVSKWERGEKPPSR
jgi:hypothetical protein